MKTCLLSVLIGMVAFGAVLSQTAKGQTCSGSIENSGFDRPVPSNASGNSWTSSNVDYAGGWSSDGGVPGAMFRLNSGGDFGTDPCVETLVQNLCPGYRYSLSGSYRSYYISRRDPDAFRCYLDGDMVVSAPGGEIGEWRRWEYEFTATQTTARLRLCGECNGTDDDFAVDSVSIVRRYLVITRQPTDVSVTVDSPVLFIVEADNPCQQPVTFQWQRRVPSVPDDAAPGAWVDLSDGGGIMNATTGALTITQPQLAFATGFRCRIVSTCAAGTETVYSRVVNFSLACPADFNADGGIDFSDVEAFFERWENGC